MSYRESEKLAKAMRFAALHDSRSFSYIGSGVEQNINRLYILSQLLLGLRPSLEGLCMEVTQAWMRCDAITGLSEACPAKESRLVGVEKWQPQPTKVITMRKEAELSYKHLYP